MNTSYQLIIEDNTLFTRYLSYNEVDDSVVEIKQINSIQGLPGVMNEVHVLDKLSKLTSFVKKPIEVIKSKSESRIKYQYIAGETLYNLMALNQAGAREIDITTKCSIALFVSSIFIKCHDLGYLVPLFTPDSITVDQDNSFYLNSLNYLSPLKENSSTQLIEALKCITYRSSTAEYLAPEISLKDKVCEESDTYTLAMFLYHLFFKVEEIKSDITDGDDKFLNREYMESDYRQSFPKEKEFQSSFYKDLILIIQKMCEPNCLKRISIDTFIIEFKNIVQKYCTEIGIDNIKVNKWGDMFNANNKYTVIKSNDSDNISQLLKKCADSGYASSMILLGAILFFKGKQEKAVFWLQKCLEMYDGIHFMYLPNIDSYLDILNLF